VLPIFAFPKILNASKYICTGLRLSEEPIFSDASSCFYLKIGTSVSEILFSVFVFMNTRKWSFMVQDPKINQKERGVDQTCDTKFVFCDTQNNSQYA